MKKIIVVVTLGLVLSLLSLFAIAQTYEISNLVISSGGGNLSGPNYELQLVIGDVAGNQSSTNYELCLGWLCTVDVTPPDISCSNCHSPDPVPSDSEITFSPTVYDAETGVSKTEICKVPACTLTYCSNDVSVGAATSETRTCTYIPKACDYANYSYWVRVTDHAGNANTTYGGKFSVKKAGGCSCSSSEECSAGTCLNGACVKVESPNATFAGGDMLIPLGTTGLATISVKNPLPIADTIAIHLYGEPAKIGYWSWFQGHRYDTQKMDMNLSFNALETRNISVGILGAQLVNNYKLTVWVESKTTALRGRDSRLISVGTAKEGVLSVGAPDLSWISLIFIALLSTLILWRKRF